MTTVYFTAAVMSFTTMILGAQVNCCCVLTVVKLLCKCPVALLTRMYLAWSQNKCFALLPPLIPHALWHPVRLSQLHDLTLHYVDAGGHARHVGQDAH